MIEILEYIPQYIIYISVILAVFGFYNNINFIIFISGMLFGFGLARLIKGNI